MMLLFLDFDGVMHPVRCGVDQYFCRLGLLEDWLQRQPDVEVVISSSWRAVHPLDEIQSYFGAEFQHRIVGATPQLMRGSWDKGGEVFVREKEIALWRSSNSSPDRPWGALDDMPELFSVGHRHLVVVDGAVGLTEADLALLDQLLQRNPVPSDCETQS